EAASFGPLPLQEWSAPRPPAFSVIPVVGDGKWIWTKPPANQSGYLEPRSYEVKVGIEIEGTGRSSQIIAATPAPIACDEQKIDAERVDTAGCQAAVRDLVPGARQLIMAVPQLAAGQIARAAATFKLTISKQYLGYERDQFPEKQP